MIGKNHVAPDCNSEINVSSLRESDESSVNAIVREMRSAPVRAASYEINWPSWENDIQATRRSREFCHDLRLRLQLGLRKQRFDAAVADFWAARGTRASTYRRRASQSEASTSRQSLREYRRVLGRLRCAQRRCAVLQRIGFFRLRISCRISTRGKFSRVRNFLANVLASRIA
jgi:uncharacterized protein (UPF0548 family)